MSRSPSFFAKYWKWFGAVMLLLAFGAAWHFFPVKEWVQAFSQWVEQRGAWGVVVFIAGYALGTVLFFPGALLTIGAGLAFGLWRGVLVASVSSVLGASLAFLVARHLARHRIEAYAKKNEKFAAIDQAIGAQGWKIVALLRLSPLLPFNASNYFYGVTGIGFWPYVAASWVGMLPGTFLYVYLGAAGKEASGVEAAGPWKWTLFGLGLSATIVVTVIITRVARQSLKKSAVGSKK